MLEALSKKEKILFFIILSIMILIIIYYMYHTLYKEDLRFSYNNNLIENNLIQNTEELNTSYSETLEENFIVVYICGAVKKNKVVTLKENSRICDAIDATGGLTKEADLTNINLAYILEDGEKVYIPKKGEETENISSSRTEGSSYTNYSSNSLKHNKININKATQTELETIPGVGPSTALKIINYREEIGKFSSIEDLKNVSGIGYAKFEKMKDYISIK